MKRRFKTARELVWILLWAGIFLSLLGLFPGDVSAHRVNLFAWVEGNTVFVECKWPDGKRVTEGTIRVLDATGAELLTGKTDQEGNFSFKIPKQEDLKIVLEAGMGHRAEWTVRKEDLAAASKTENKAPMTLGEQTPKSEPSPSASKEAALGTHGQGKPSALGKTVTKAPAPLSRVAVKAEPAPAVSGAAAPGSQAPTADIEQTLEKALDKKLSPILRMLAELHDQGPKVSDVLGGIGYIIGLVGIAAYFKGKAKAS